MTAKKGCGRPVGRRVREALQILDRIGPSTRKEMLPHFANMTRLDDPSKYLRRAVAYGLAEQIEERPARYRALPGWQETLMRPAEPMQVVRVRVSSVWEFAQRCAA